MISLITSSTMDPWLWFAKHLDLLHYNYLPVSTLQLSMVVLILTNGSKIDNKDIIILTVGSVITVLCFLIGYLCVSSLVKYGNTVSDQGSAIVSKDIIIYRVMVFDATFNNISVMSWQSVVLCHFQQYFSYVVAVSCLMPLSKIFQLCRGSQFYCWSSQRKPLICSDRMVVGSTTTCAISAYHH